MRDSEGEGALIKDFSDADNYLEKEINSQQKEKKKRNLFILIAIIVIVIVVIIIVVLILTLLNDDPDPDSDKKEEEKTDPKNEIDTIPKEEMNKARNTFKQYKYIDTVNNSYSLDYNLFIPANYIKEKKYPLIIFIEDASLVGTDKIKSPLDDTVGGPIWATDREQEKHECFVLAPLYTTVIIDDNRGAYYVNEYINVTVRLIEKLIGEFSIKKVSY